MSSPRLPTPSDFPPNLTLSITPPPSSTPPINVLILLHGLGDTNQPFTRLAENLNLSETACISLQGPNPIPPLFIGDHVKSAFHWGDDVLVDESKGEIDMDAGFEVSRKVLMDIVVGEVLVGKCGFPRRNILFYGFGQGGMAALKAVASSFLSSSSSPQTDHEYAGIISIGACLPPSFSTSSSSPKNKTPVLILAGSRSTQVTKDRVDKLKTVFEFVEYVRWSKYEDSMPRSREEMLPVMKFFARRLRSVAGVPEGAVEIG